MSHLALSALLLPPPKPDSTRNYHVTVEGQRHFYGARVWEDAFTVAVGRNPFHLLVLFCEFGREIIANLSQSHPQMNQAASAAEVATPHTRHASVYQGISHQHIQRGLSGVQIQRGL